MADVESEQPEEPEESEEPQAETSADGPVDEPVDEAEAEAAEEPSEEPSEPSEAAQETAVAAAAVAAEPAAEAVVTPPPAAPAEPAPAPAPAPAYVPEPEPEPAPEAHHFLDRRKALLIGGAGVIVVGGAVAAFAASGSGSQTSASSQHDGSTGTAGSVKTSASASASPTPTVPLPTIATVPANGATGVDPSKPITVQVLNGTIESVALSGQGQTNGTLSTDGSSWTSANALSVDTSYSITVSAKNSVGKVATSTIAFRTLAPAMTFGVSSVVPPRGSTVGVGQPIRVTFSNYVPSEYKAALEKACVVTTNPGVKGAWYWVSNSGEGAVLDWRPENYWPVNTSVSVAFNLDGVKLGEHQYGVENYRPTHDFTISSRDLRLIVDKDTFQATCYQDGKVIRTFPIDTGMTTAETFVTYTGTMAVLGKGNPVEMKGNYGPGDTYDDFVNWATQITWSGTYVHAAPWDSDIGSANDDSHGCIHCHTVDAEWFYGLVIDGDVVTVNGSNARTVAVDNGICTFTLDWADLVKGSAYGPTLNGKPVSA